MRTLVCLGVVLALTSVAFADDKDAKFMKGKIVKVNPDLNTIVIKADEKEVELKTQATTKFIGADRKPLTEGLKFQGLKEGTDVWYQLSADDKTIITELRLSDPKEK